MAQYGWYPSKYNRRYVDYSIEIINDPQQQRDSISIAHFMQTKSIWGSIMDTPFSPSAEVWLASHLIDYSIVSSSVHQYLNSILELGDHESIRNKLKYFVHNKSLLMTPSGDWISYKGINLNLQHSAHLASKFAIKPASSSSESESEIEEGPSKKIKAATAGHHHALQQGCLSDHQHQSGQHQHQAKLQGH
eukprot:3171903-Amphidinium_carterae.1